MIRLLSAKLLLIGAAFSVGSAVLVRIMQLKGMHGFDPVLQEAIFAAGGMIGCVIAFYLCLAVAGDHRPGAFLHSAWILFSGDALMQFFRYLIESPLGQRSLFGPARVQARNLVVIGGLIFLLAGLLVMWVGFRRMRLGLRLLPHDVAIIVSLTVFGSVAATVEVIRIGWTLRTPILAMMFGGAIVGIMLLRFAKQMQSGQIYLVIKMLIFYLGSRCIQNFFIASGLWDTVVFGTVILALQSALPWILCIGAAMRLQVTLVAAHQIRSRRLEFDVAAQKT